MDKPLRDFMLSLCKDKETDQDNLVPLYFNLASFISPKLVIDSFELDNEKFQSYVEKQSKFIISVHAVWNKIQNLLQKNEGKKADVHQGNIN